MTIRSSFSMLAVLGVVLVGCTASGSRTPSPTPAAAEPAAAPSSATPAPSGSLWGSAWQLQDLGGTPALEKVEATLEFPEQGKVSGRGSCNRFFGTVEISGDTIKFGPLAATKMACLDAGATAQETKYLDALQKAERFAFDGPVLLVYSTATEKPLRFSRK